MAVLNLLLELKRKNMTQSELARKSGINEGIISEIVNCKRIPSKDQKRAIAAAMGISQELIFRELII